MAGSAHCSAAERKRFFRGKAGRLFEHREAGEFLPAPKKAFARGKPKAKLHGPVLLVLFLPTRKVHG